MTPPRKRQYDTANERTAASRARREAEGMRQVSIWLSAEAVGKLDQLAEKEGAASRGEVIEAMLKRRKV
ncbi:MAG: ribbon-helix-helix protein, CopG family [Pseudomonadota bacterium]